MAILTLSRVMCRSACDTADKRFVDFEAMLVELAKADVVFVGEQHDDPNTHRLELAILKDSAVGAAASSSRSRCSSATRRSRSSTSSWIT